MKKSTLFSFVLISSLLSAAFPFSSMAAEEEEWRNEQVYSIIVDRFNNADSSNDHDIDISDPDAYHGGDLEGVIEQLDELRQMGFTAIRLTPIMDNAEDGYHGYWVEDFMAVEENFGTVEDARRLVDEAHERDMKVIFGFVVNHTAETHPWLEDEETADWFQSADDETAGLSGLPELDQSNPEVRDYLFDAAAFWINETGVDGFHIDSVDEVSEEFWKEFSDYTRSIDPDFFLSGEVWSDDPAYIASYQDAGFDSLADYPFYETATNTFASVGNSLEPLYNLWEYNRELYEQPQLLNQFMDNQDTRRFTRMAVENGQNPVTRWKMAYTYLYTTPGLPVIFQGSEVPMDGGEVPDNRRMVAFNSGDDELRKYLETLAAVRQEYPALTAGDFEMVESEGAMSLFKRTYQEESVYVAINNSTETHTIPVTDLEEGQQMRGLLLDNIVRQQENGEWWITLDRETADIFVIQEDTGVNWLFISFIGLVMGGFIFAVIYLSRKGRSRSEV